ncbi:MAG TPA: kelch repeat-containing protein [Nitrososphaeraceae archaeon]|nr:kelch repeat-containing protein [Nitrososphaeraceae archaeon]
MVVCLILSIHGNLLVQQRKVFSETSKSLESFGIYLPSYRTEVTSTYLGDNIYVIGGLDKPGKALDTV